MNLGENIYRLRIERNLSQGGLADALEVSRQSVSKWENNSAVPELDKLVKMAQLFGVSLDELVTGEHKEEAEPPAQQEPKVIYIEKPAKQAIAPAQIFGIILLFCSAFAFFMSLMFDELQDLEEWVPLYLLATLCGILCLVTKRPLLWSGWIAVFGYWFYCFGITYRWEEQLLLIILGILLVAAILAYTISLHKRGIIHIPAWGMALLAIALAAAAFLLIINLIPSPSGVGTPVRPADMG